MKCLIPLAIFLILQNAVSAQDIVNLKDGESIGAFVVDTLEIERIDTLVNADTIALSDAVELNFTSLFVLNDSTAIIHKDSIVDKSISYLRFRPVGKTKNIKVLLKDVASIDFNALAYQDTEESAQEKELLGSPSSFFGNRASPKEKRLKKDKSKGAKKEARQKKKAKKEEAKEEEPEISVSMWSNPEVLLSGADTMEMAGKEIKELEPMAKTVKLEEEEETVPLDKKTVTEEDTASKKRSRMNHGFALDLLGLAQFGPIVQYELGLFKNFYAVPIFRYNYAGILSHWAWDLGESDDLSYLSYSGGLGFKYFFPKEEIDGDSEFLYLGVFGMYSIDEVHWYLEETLESEEIRESWEILLNIGYRWLFKTGFHINLGAYGGYSNAFYHEIQEVQTGFLSDRSLGRDYTFFGMAELSFGLSF